MKPTVKVEPYQCPDCGGSGVKDIFTGYESSGSCHTCRGYGVVQAPKKTRFNKVK